MPVLSRRPGETIMIGEHVEVCVLKLLDGRVNIGISAPKDVAILRGELKDRLRRIDATTARTDQED